MARYYTLQIDSIYLTSDGTASGKACRLRINGVEALRINYAGQTSASADGTPQTVAFALGTKGRPISVVVDYMPKAVLDSIVTALNSALENNATLTLVGAGDLGNFSLEAVPSLPNPIQASGEFSNSILKSVTLNFITAS